MKRRFTILTAALALLAFLAIPMGMWGQTQTPGDATLTWSGQGLSNQTSVDGVAYNLGDYFTVTCAKNGAATAPTYYTTGTAVRCYATKSTNNGNIITVAKKNSVTDDVFITKVEYNGTHSKKGTTSFTYSGNPSSTTATSASYNSSDEVTTASATLCETGGSANGQFYFTDVKVEYVVVSGGTPPTTYTVTFDAGDGTFVGSTDFPNASNTVAAGTYTLPSAERSGYTFDGWVTGNNDPITGSYTVSGNVAFTAAYTENTTPTPGGNLNLTFDLTSNPGSWPTSASTTLTNFDYTLAGVDYTFALNNVYCNSGYLMLKSVAVLGLPAIEGYKLTTVVAHNSNGCSTSTKVGISSSATQASYIAGGAAQTWSTQGSTYTYNLTSTEENTMYYLYVTNKNAQLFSLDLTYEAVAATTVATPTFDPASGTEFGDEGLNVSITCETNDASIYYTLNGDTPNNQSTLYNGAISVTETTTIKAIAFDGTNYSNVATATYTYVDPNAPGTVNNPYTVAQAIANTPSSGNVYIQGIVSSFYNTSIVGDGSNYRYYISDDGTTTTQLLVYKGKGLNQATFTNANDLLVGDEVVIYGSLITYQNAPEVASGNYLYSWNRPAADVEAPTFSPAAGTYATAQSVTISCATTGANIYYTTDGTEPTSASTPYTSAIAVSNTTTIKAIAYVGNESSTVATATYHFCSAEDPYTVTEALAFNEYPANGIYVSGIVSTAPTSLSNGTLTYYISVDGTATNELEVYKGKGLNNESFTAADDIQVGDIVTIYGNVVIYNNTKEFAQGNYLVSFERPAQEYTLTVTCSANVEIFTFVNLNEQGIEGPTIQQVTSGTEVGISVSATTGYNLTLVVDGIDVTSQLDNSGYYSFYMPTHNVTVTATASAAPVLTTNTYTLATSIESGKTYIIVGQADGDYYAMGNDKGNNRYAYGITLNGTTATATVAEGNYVHEFTINSLATPGFYSICDAITPGYLYAASSSKNYLKTETTLDENHNGDWKITFDAESGTASVVASNSEYTHNIMRFNNSDILFSCYTTGQHPVYLYVKDETPVSDTYTKTIIGYNSPQGNGEGNYYLIASPIGDVAPTAVTSMTTGSYDLYYFDHAADKEWVNYKPGTGSNHPGFDLVSGTGYLYANSQTIDLVFTGTAHSTEDVEIVLSRTETADGYTVDMPGWNLVGNPFAVTAYIADGRDFYTMNSDGTDFEISNNPERNIDAMEGIFVIAQQDGETMTFTTTQPPTNNGKSVALNLSNGRNVIDRAMVRFGEGRTLPKFQLNKNHTKVYIPMDGQDYAVVRSEEMGEMPVNFKAENNGTYSLSLSCDNVEFAYLHLIDNLTGKDIDLLQTPSYSFEAKTTDYESRFKLVFATGDNSDNETFAFFSNGSFVINNEDNATLQVIDITGRILKSESINGCANVNVNAAPGVYMLRLVNGDNVKVQKVVVK